MPARAGFLPHLSLCVTKAPQFDGWPDRGFAIFLGSQWLREDRCGIGTAAEGCQRERSMSTPSLIHCGEFVDALAALRRGHVIVALDRDARTCVLDGSGLHWSFRTLHEYGLVAEFDNPDGFAGLRYFRLTAVGAQFADRALAAWHERPWHQRLMIRLRG